MLEEISTISSSVYNILQIHLFKVGRWVYYNNDVDLVKHPTSNKRQFTDNCDVKSYQKLTSGPPGFINCCDVLVNWTRCMLLTNPERHIISAIVFHIQCIRYYSWLDNYIFLQLNYGR